METIKITNENSRAEEYDRKNEKISIIADLKRYKEKK